jgi:hypothetical protein
MKLHTLLIVGFALSMSGCAEKEQAVPEAVDEVQTPPPSTEASPAKAEEWMDDAFLKHMHRHADELDDLNLALADGDLSLQTILKPALNIRDMWRRQLACCLWSGCCSP